MYTYIKRFFFFILTNIAIMTVLTGLMMILNIFFPGIIDANGSMLGLLIIATVVGFTGSFISLFLSRWSAKRAYNITLLEDGNISNDKLKIVWDTVARIAQANNIKQPEVGYYESPEPNAFATGASKNSSLVAVSTGLLDLMNKDEIEGVVGHEMAHILNGDMVTLTLIQGVMNTFVYFLSTLIARAISSYLARDNDNVSSLTYSLISFVLQISLGFLASFVVMYASRIREYRADLGGATYTSKSKMIAGLKKLKTITAKTKIHDGKMTAFMITEPDSMFSTHPSLDNRISALENNFKL
ncbi:MAG: protease HtpX [Candidatus Altimarinota bacterium]